MSPVFFLSLPENFQNFLGTRWYSFVSICGGEGRGDDWDVSRCRNAEQSAELEAVASRLEVRAARFVIC